MAELGSPQPPTIPASADPLIDTTDTRPPARPGPETVSRFLLITIGEGAQSGPLNPFQLHRAVSRFGEASRVAKRSDGKVEVEMATPESAQRLLSLRALCLQTKRGTETVPVTVCAHPTKGLAVGVITAPELKDVEEEEIQEELRDQGIQKVRRLQRRDGDVSVPSDSLVLTFSQENLPSKIRIAWRNAAVRPYAPYPLRCFRCQAYGHIASRCRGQERCARCSSLGHCSASCKASPKCTCGGDHEVWSRDCPKLQAEKRRARERVSGARTAAPPPSDGTTPAIERPVQNTGTPAAPYRSALLRRRHPPQEAPTPHPPVPAITAESRVQDCMQLTVRQFLTLLSDSHRATQSAEAASATTNDVGVQCSISDMLHRQAQTDPADEQPVPPRRDAAVQCALEAPTAPPVHPPQNRRPPARESVKDGVRHEECAGQTRDAKRVRFAQQVGETKRPPHPDTAPGSDSDSEDERPTGTGFAAISSPPPVSVPSGSHPVRPPPSMAPPLPRQRPLPAPPPSAASEGAAPPMTPVSASGRMVPPSAPERPTKRVLPAEFSPTGDGSPRTRQSSSSGVRLTLVDGKGKPAKQRITFKEPTSRSPASSDWEELF